MSRTLLGTLFPEGSKYGTKRVLSCTSFLRVYECRKEKENQRKYIKNLDAKPDSIHFYQFDISVIKVVGI